MFLNSPGHLAQLRDNLVNPEVLALLRVPGTRE